jgi:predicted phage terminase large subunit-like protein
VFEANNGGHEYCSTIDTRLREKNIRLNLTSRPAPTRTGKVARIVKVAPEIRRMYFISPKYASQEYRAFLQQLCTFVITGKNEHDDAADSLAQLVSSMSANFGVVTVHDRPY